MKKIENMFNSFQVEKNVKELEKTMNQLSSGKRINHSTDDNAGLSINTRLPGEKEPTEEEKRIAHERWKKQWEENRVRYLKEHPPLGVQMDTLLTVLKELKEIYPNEERFLKIERIIEKTKEDHVDSGEWE